ncbi:hypothetical protein [Rhizobium sp. LC145]|uniref:hypothetical protein n=1 Tax=Rhizobium sp. LC145 TaxID=1120688 RepID=UPI00062A452A|nr:hypothetical protein [Rhizobium sp. LC145]KKX34079.1 hypothetical protein YH62_02600 [Rhizobium sp. LC145]TKT66949.1 hypothetical protein FDR95_04535 [Rhizobiaceae bacterium LC148]
MSEKLKLNPQLCKHAYDEAVERIARLAAYATSRSLKILGFGDYFSLAEELCKKDLIILAISVRRLAEMTKSTSELKNLRIKAMITDERGNHTGGQENCWDIVGNILHGVEIDVFKDVGKYISEDFMEIMRNKDEIDAAISIKSEKFHKKMFKLTDFLRCINEYLDKADETLSDNGIFVSDLYQ